MGLVSGCGVAAGGGVGCVAGGFLQAPAVNATERIAAAPSVTLRFINFSSTIDGKARLNSGDCTWIDFWK